jgi:hypothetical protein
MELCPFVNFMLLFLSAQLLINYLSKWAGHWWQGSIWSEFTHIVVTFRFVTFCWRSYAPLLLSRRRFSCLCNSLTTRPNELGIGDKVSYEVKLRNIAAIQINLFCQSYAPLFIFVYLVDCDMVGWLAWCNEPVSYVGGSVIRLVGLTKSNWSWAKSQTKNGQSSIFCLFLTSVLYSSPFLFLTVLPST